jgi:SAM-dependent methyltransferase
VVGAAGGQGRAAAELAGQGLARQQLASQGLARQLSAAYGDAVRLWADGPEQVYAPLAGALVAACGQLHGRRVLDIGAGTGVAGRAALGAGAAQVVSADISAGMLRQCGARLALPFGPASFDDVLAAFCLGHLPSLDRGLREARRVGAALAASAFAPGWTHPAKAAVDATLRDFGYRPPAWYEVFKRDTEPLAGSPGVLGPAAAAAGFNDVRIAVIDVPTGVSQPAQLAAWRLGMAHVAPFVRALDASRRAELRQAAQAAVAGSAPLVVSMQVLTAS